MHSFYAADKHKGNYSVHTPMNLKMPPVLIELGELVAEKGGLVYSAMRFDGSSSSIRADDGRHDGIGTIDFLVVEGPYTYYLASECAGWGSVVDSISTATVRAIKTVSSSGERRVVGEAEVRANTLRPAYNAELYARAAMALVLQGCLQRTGQPLPGVPEFRIPRRSAWTDGKRLARRIAQGVRKRLRRQRKQWNIGVLRNEDVATARPFPWSKVKWIEPLVDGFVADPFLVQDGDDRWLFYERLLYEENQGTLWVGKLDPATAKLSDCREVLRTEFHLSFPNVFQLGGTWYMFPEEGRSGMTHLYRATAFPFEWKLHQVVLGQFPGIDPVLWEHDGKWWLFVSHGAAPCSDNNLFLFYADRIDGEWKPHPLNPIKSGLYGSRMAGPLRRDGGRLLRPGQDCRQGYGMGLVLHEILELTTQSYSERVIVAWPPESGAEYDQGFHHFMQCGGSLVIDGQRNQRI